MARRSATKFCPSNKKARELRNWIHSEVGEGPALTASLVVVDLGLGMETGLQS